MFSPTLRYRTHAHIDRDILELDDFINKNLTRHQVRTDCASRTTENRIHDPTLSKQLHLIPTRGPSGPLEKRPNDYSLIFN